MAKFRLSSLFNPSSSSSSTGTNAQNAAEAERKKQNRRSFSAFSSLASQRAKDELTNGKSAKAAPVAKASEAAAPAESRMLTLAKKISAETEKLDAYLKENNIAPSSFDVNSPSDFPKLPAEIQNSRQEIIYATKELESLARGPREEVRWKIWGFLDSLSLLLINHFGLAQLVPVDGTITLAELQGKTSLDPVNLARILRHAMTNHIFTEPTPGVIAHTAASRLLAEDGSLQAWVGFNGEDIFRAGGHVLEALKTFPEATSLTRTGFNFGFGTVDKEPMFATFGKDPARAKRMGGAMVSLTGGEGYEVKYLVDSYDFTEIDARGGKFVDVGGSHGFVCVDLAKKWKNMKFVVQDLPKTVESAPKPLSEDTQVAERIELMAHDFFKEQTVKDADVFFFRWIIHNYSTPYAISILKNLIPALKPGAKILINDHCLREPGSENPWDEKVMRSMDMVMLTLLNAQERDEAEFRALFKAADERFVFKGVSRPEGCRMSIVEAVWMPEEVKEAEEVKAVEEAKPTEETKPAEETPAEEKPTEAKPAEEPKVKGDKPAEEKAV